MEKKHIEKCSILLLIRETNQDHNELLFAHTGWILMRTLPIPDSLGRYSSGDCLAE